MSNPCPAMSQPACLPTCLPFPTSFLASVVPHSFVRSSLSIAPIPPTQCSTPFLLPCTPSLLQTLTLSALLNSTHVFWHSQSHGSPSHSRSNAHSNFASTSRISLYATFFPMQLRGPSEKGLKAGDEEAGGLGGRQPEGRKAEGDAKWRGERLVAYWGGETWVWWGVVSLGCILFRKRARIGVCLLERRRKRRKGGERRKTYTSRNSMPGDELALGRDDTGQAFRNGRREA